MWTRTQAMVGVAACAALALLVPPAAADAAADRDPGLLQARDLPGRWTRFVPQLGVSGPGASYGTVDPATCMIQSDRSDTTPAAPHSSAQFVDPDRIGAVGAPSSASQLEETIYEFSSPRVAADVLAKFRAVFRTATKCWRAKPGKDQLVRVPLERSPRGVLALRQGSQDTVMFHKGRAVAWIIADPTRFADPALGTITRRAYQRIRATG